MLPFLNLGGDAGVERLARGLTEDLITDLARFRNLDVIALNSSEGYKGEAGEMRRLARKLGVRYALEGSLQQEGGQVRVTAQLLDPASGAHLWGDRWDRPSVDVFAIQSEVAEAVAGQLGGYNGTIVTVDQDLAKRKRPEDLGAYEQYLVGLASLNLGTKSGIEAAIGSFERSIAIDPTLARAWTGLARSYLQLRDQVEDGRDPLRRAIDAARRAVALDARDAEAAAALAFALGEQGDLAESEAMFDRALALNPSSAEILTSYASWASTFGKPEAGVEAAQRALRLNPNMPPSGSGEEPLRLLHDRALRRGVAAQRSYPARGLWPRRFHLPGGLAQRDRQRRGCPGCGHGGTGALPVDLGRGLVRPSRLQRCGAAALGGDDAQGGLSPLRRRPGAGRAVGGAAADRVRVAAGHMNVRRLPIRPRRRTLPSLDTRRLRMHV